MIYLFEKENALYEVFGALNQEFGVIVKPVIVQPAAVALS